MHTKFESKSNRVKGLSFHPTRPWILSSLHNGAIQLWDYRNRCLIHTFEEHDGPVRGVDFHASQPLFVSGGDDYKIKVWNYKLKCCLFTLLGHLDYIRTVKFHHEHPWILSASDDQTIRLWNWQSRSPMSTLTGHNHYVMSAFFHPQDPLIVSASLDNTVRVWDIAPLVKSTNSSGFGGMSGDVGDMGGLDLNNMNNMNSGLSKMNAELFGGGDVSVKYLLEGHDRGVNWASFHPTLPLIVSGADDRQVKLWRMNETKAWEVDTLRGHTNNVSSVIFHTTKDLIVSNAEDRSIKIWDISRRVCIQTYKREHDRFWILTAHPTKNILAAGHDSGMMVFTLDRERPAYNIFTSTEQEVYYVKDERFLRRFKYGSQDDDILATLPKISDKVLNRSAKLLVKNDFNSAEVNILVIYDKADLGKFQLVNISSSGVSDEDDGLRGSGIAACFVARNRFIVLEPTKKLSIRNLKNETTKRVNVPIANLQYIFPTGISGRILIKADDKLYLFEVQSRKILGEVTFAQVKYVVWDSECEYCALLSKTSVMICDKMLNQMAVVSESIRVKSGVWNQTRNVFVYSTLNHVKYLITNGDNGVLCTLEAPIYITKFQPLSKKLQAVKGGANHHVHTVYGLNREFKIVQLKVNTAECDFKVALMNQQFGQVMKIIKNNKISGQSIIGYLQEKGFPEVALHFVEDKQVRFKLALSCGNLDVAMQSCLELDENVYWTKLASEALIQGNYSIVEMCYQKTRNFDKLSFLYLIGGDGEKLVKMLKIAENRGDVMSRFQNSLFLGNVEERVKVLESVNQVVLAYVTASAHNLTEHVQRLKEKLEALEIPVPDAGEISSKAALLPLPKVLWKASGDRSWPTLEVRKGVVHEALLKGIDLMGEEELVDSPVKGGKQPNGFGTTEEPSDLFDDDDDFLDLNQESKPTQETETETKEVEEDDDAGWGAMSDDDLDLDLGGDGFGGEQTPQANDSFEDFTATQQGSEAFSMPKPGVEIPKMWLTSSNLAADHAAYGDFESAQNLLNRQIGVVNFKPLMKSMQDIYLSAQVSVPTLGSVSSLAVELLRDDEDVDLDNDSARTKVLSKSCFTLSATLKKVDAAYTYFQTGQFKEALGSFREILYAIPFIVAGRAEEIEVKELLAVCREYTLGLLIEMQRKEINAAFSDKKEEQPVEDRVRALELAVYFSSCNLEHRHLVLVLNVAMKSAYKMNNFITAAHLAKRLLSMSEINLEANKDKKKIALKVLKKSEASGRNEHQLNYKKEATFTVCGVSLTPVYPGEAFIKCPFCQVTAKVEFRSRPCPVCEVANLGVETLGLLSCSTDRA